MAIGTFTVALAAPAAAVTDPADAIKNDPNANLGSIAFYNSAGSRVTSGNAASLSHMFDYAVASSAGRSNAFVATVYYAFPDHTIPDSQNWVSNQQNAGTEYPVSSGPSNITSQTNPVATADANYADMNAAAQGVTQDTTAGYQGIVQIRLYDSGIGVPARTDAFWATDVYYDANGWQQVFPATAQSTITSLTASPSGGATPGSMVTLTASVSPSAAAGNVEFFDGTTSLGTSPVSAGTASLTTTTLTNGTHSLTAKFTPSDTNAYNGSTSDALSYVIGNVPAAPTAVHATAGHAAATVSWTETPATGDAPVTSYTIEKSTDAGTTWTAAGTSTTTSKLVTGLVNGTGYVFHVKANSAVGSSAFSVPSTAIKPFADKSSLSISRSLTINYGRTTTVQGRLIDTTHNTAVARVPVTLYYRHSTTGAWLRGPVANTSTTGYASFAQRPTSRIYYQLRYAGSTVNAAATSATQTVSVAQTVSIAATPRTVTHGKQFAVWGGVTPGVSRAVVTLQRKFGARYRNVGTARVLRQRLPNGRTALGYVFRIVQRTRGTYTYRVYRAASSTLAAGTSAATSIRVV